MKIKKSRGSHQPVWGSLPQGWKKPSQNLSTTHTSESFLNRTTCFYWDARHSSGDKMGSKGAQSEP